jgi:hypothetical protein
MCSMHLLHYVNSLPHSLVIPHLGHFSAQLSCHCLPCTITSSLPHSSIPSLYVHAPYIHTPHLPFPPRSHSCLPPMSLPLGPQGTGSRGLSCVICPPYPLTVSEPPPRAFSWPWWYVLLGALVAAACVLILALFLVHRRKKETRYG